MCISAPKPLTFDFELPASAAASSPHASSDPFSSSRTRLRSARSRNIDRGVQSRSQNDVFATPAADASKFLDMLGRASARVDENSRKRMKKALGERTGTRSPTKRSVIKGGKERLCDKTRKGTRSMDELGDHTNFVRDPTSPLPETRVHYSSLPIMLESQSKDTAPAEYKNDVHMHNGTSTASTTTAAVAVPASGNDGIKPPVSARPQNGTQLFPPRATLSTRRSQKRIEPPSPTPVRPSAAPPIPLHPVPAPAPTSTPAPVHKPKSVRTSDSVLPKTTPGPLPHTQQLHPVPVPTPLPPTVNDVLLKGAGVAAAAAASAAVPMTESLARHGKSTSAAASTSATAAATAATLTSKSLISAHPPPSQTHVSKRALGMTRSVPRPLSSSSSPFNNTPHSAATKKPFRPPLARPAAAAAASASQAAAKPPILPNSSHSRDSQRQRQQEEGGSKKGFGADPDSSFDLSFDFDPEALEAVMKKYD